MSQTATVPQFATSLSHFINSKSGFAWPSMRTLAKRSKSSLSSVKRALKQLASLGFLQIEPGGCRHTNRYRAVLRRAEAQSRTSAKSG